MPASRSEGASCSSVGPGSACMRIRTGFLVAYPTSTHSMSCSVLAKAGDSLERDYCTRWAGQSDGPRDAGERGRRGRAACGAAVDARRCRRARCRCSIRRARERFVRAPDFRRAGHRAVTARSSCSMQSASRFAFVSSTSKRIRGSRVRSRARRSTPKVVATRRRRLVERGSVLQGTCCRAIRRGASGSCDDGQRGRDPQLDREADGGHARGPSKDCDEAFVVGELLGQGVNTVTGDTRVVRRGLGGRGEIVHPVHEVTIAGNLADLFREIQASVSDIGRARHRALRRRARVDALRSRAAAKPKSASPRAHIGVDEIGKRTLGNAPTIASSTSRQRLRPSVPLVVGLVMRVSFAARAHGCQDVGYDRCGADRVPDQRCSFVRASNPAFHERDRNGLEQVCRGTRIEPRGSRCANRLPGSSKSLPTSSIIDSANRSRVGIEALGRADRAASTTGGAAHRTRVVRRRSKISHDKYTRTLRRHDCEARVRCFVAAHGIR